MRRMKALGVREIRASRARCEALGERVRGPSGVRVSRWGRGPAGSELHQPLISWGGREGLYLHGGAFAVGSARVYRAFLSTLADATRSRVRALEYRLAPEHPFPAAVDDAFDAWRALLDEGVAADRCWIGGDSAGGGLAMALALRARDAGLPHPAATVLLSPWVDLTGAAGSLDHNAERDQYLSPHLFEDVTRGYLRGALRTHPWASPLFADLTGLPPVLVHASRSELLLDDARRLAARLRAAGGASRLELWNDLPHAFHLFAPVLPEARRAIERIAAWLEPLLGDEPDAAGERQGIH